MLPNDELENNLFLTLKLHNETADEYFDYLPDIIVLFLMTLALIGISIGLHKLLLAFKRRFIDRPKLSSSADEKAEP